MREKDEESKGEGGREAYEMSIEDIEQHQPISELDEYCMYNSKVDLITKE